MKKLFSADGGENRGRSQTHIRFHLRTAASGNCRQTSEVSAQKQHKDQSGIPETRSSGGKAKDCENMPHRPAVDLCWNYPVWLRCTGHTPRITGGIGAGDLISVSAVPCALFYSLCKLSHGNLHSEQYNSWTVSGLSGTLSQEPHGLDLPYEWDSRLGRGQLCHFKNTWPVIILKAHSPGSVFPWTQRPPHPSHVFLACPGDAQRLRPTIRDTELLSLGKLCKQDSHSM